MKNIINWALPATLISLGFAARPGDQAKLTAVNPAYSLENITPSGFFPIGGMDFLGNDLVVSSWKDPTGIYIIKNATGPKSGMTMSEYAIGIAEALGLKVVNGNIYVLQKEELTQMIDNDHDGKADEYRAITYDWTKSIMEKEYAVGLAWDGNFFYAAYGDPTMGSGTSVDPIPAGRHNGVLQLGLDGSSKPYAGGMRVPTGIQWMFGKLWVQDIQGGYRPTNPLFQVNQGDWFGRPVNPPSVFQTHPFSEFSDDGPNKPWYKRAAIDMQFAATGDQRWSPGGRCPGQAVSLTEGPYKNQILIPDADASTSGISRVSMEIVGGAYQGANYHFSGAAPFAADALYRMVVGPDGAIYIGGNGSNNAGWTRTTPQGLDRMKLTGTVPMDILAVRSKSSTTFEFEFTKPLSNAAGADVKGNLEVRKWFPRYQNTYGAGFQQGAGTCGVTSAIVSSDKKKILATLTGLQEGYTIYFHFTGDALQDGTGQKLWGTEAWYNLNKFGPGTDVVETPTSAKALVPQGARPFMISSLGSNELRVQVTLPGVQSYRADLVDLSGRVHASRAGSGAGEFTMSTQGVGNGLYVVKLTAGNRTWSQLVNK